MKNIAMIEPNDLIKICDRGKCCDLATLKIAFKKTPVAFKDKPGKIYLCDECYEKVIAK